MREMLKFYFEGINPEPWTAPYVPRGGHAIPNKKLQAYQNAIREAIGEFPDPFTGELEVTFYFWRNRSGRAKDADATNLQKALEDALQGKIFANDRNNRYISSEIVEQGPDVEPFIAVSVARFDPLFNDTIKRFFKESGTLMDAGGGKNTEKDFTLVNQRAGVDF